MNNPGNVEYDDWYTPEGVCEYIAEPIDLEDLKKKAARALECCRMLEERQNLGRGLIWGGIISFFIWVTLGVMLANILKY